jgi:predicted metal-dependent phosphoesterase TrpH
MNGDKAVDLHTHSTASDGMLTPTQLMQSAAEAGLSGIGLTDHDTTAGLAEAQTEALRLGLVVVPGVELSASYQGREAHMLGYFIDPSNMEFQEKLAAFVKQRSERMTRMVERVNQLGIPVGLDAVLEKAGTGTVGRPHLARVMIDLGAVSTISDAFDRYLGQGKPAYVPRPRLEPEDAVRLIMSAGGAPVLAHPFSTGDARAMASRLAPVGLAGLEVWYGEYSPEQREELRQLAEANGLIPTGGSDYHGPNFKPGRDLGGPPVPWETIERLHDVSEANRRTH